MLSDTSTSKNHFIITTLLLLIGAITPGCLYLFLFYRDLFMQMNGFRLCMLSLGIIAPYLCFNCLMMHGFFIGLAHIWDKPESETGPNLMKAIVMGSLYTFCAVYVTIFFIYKWNMDVFLSIRFCLKLSLVLTAILAVQLIFERFRYRKKVMGVRTSPKPLLQADFRAIRLRIIAASLFCYFCIMKRLLLFLLTAIPFLSTAQRPKEDSLWLRQHYTKTETYIPMRDGTRLYTAIYAPKDLPEKHPFLINRTPYSIAPYGQDTFKAFWNTYWMAYFREGYIIVLQDVRGRMMSEGQFVDVRPFREHKKGKETDEASDTWDTIEWLLHHVSGNNGKAGVFGISYPGFYSTMAALSGHPALKAVSPQAPVTEWFLGDDFHHNGAFMQMDAFSFYSGFGKPRPLPTRTGEEGYRFPIHDNYKFYLEAGTLARLASLAGDSIAFFRDLYAHPDYDAFWQARNTRNFVKGIPAGTATLVVGGLFDAEDLYGAWNLYKAIEGSAKNDNRIVMGPWAHGFWSRDGGNHLGNVRFGSNTSVWYQQHMEIPFFNYYLKGKGSISDIKEANIFFTGDNVWRGFDTWPPAGMQPSSAYLQDGGALAFGAPSGGKAFTEYTSDPAKPVPYTEDVHFRRTREYMTDDQRFAARRPDVLVFQTPPLTEAVTLAGPLTADLFASISSTDADFVVKLIDVFPDDFKYNDTTDGPGTGDYPMDGYQMLVRGDIMRGRYRNSFEHPEAFVPGKITEVKYVLPDVAHVFKKGHRIMVQVQSSWFPLADRNPQQFVNIYAARAEDFIPSNIRIYHDPAHPSQVVLPVLR